MRANKLSEREEHTAETWRIRYYCARKGWSQKKLAQTAKLTTTQVNLIFAGQNITRNTCIRISRALDIPRWKFCKIDADWKKIIPRTKKLEAKVELQDRQYRKEKGLRG